jgi:hypothetical protein
VRQVGYLQELNQDAWSTKNRKQIVFLEGRKRITNFTRITDHFFLALFGDGKNIRIKINMIQTIESVDYILRVSLLFTSLCATLLPTTRRKSL